MPTPVAPGTFHSFVSSCSDVVSPRFSALAGTVALVAAVGLTLPAFPAAAMPAMVPVGTGTHPCAVSEAAAAPAAVGRMAAPATPGASVDAHLVAPASDTVPATPAEARDYRTIATPDEVADFYRTLAALSHEVRVREFGRSAEGRPLQEVVLARPAISDPWEAHASGRPIVLLNAMVHGDEPAGRDALMAFARDVALGDLSELLDDLIFVLSPELNPDGTVRGEWGARNNTFQRNVNRDYLRLVNPETRAFVPDVLAAWRPHVIVDLHELIGPPRVYDFYTSFPFDVAGPHHNWRMTRDELVPAIVAALEADGHTHFPYHRVPAGLVDDPSIGVSAGSYGARALSSYGGAAAALTVLYETRRPRDARLELDDRVRRQEVALHGMARWVATNRDRVLETVARERAELAARGARWDEADSVAVRVEQVPSRTLPYQLLVDGDTVRLEVPVLDSTRITLGRIRPVAYLIEPHRREVAEHLALHGLQVDRLLAPASIPGESYRIESVSRGDRPYEGYIERTVTTSMEAGTVEAPAGSYLVRLDQPLARIALHLLEPEDENSLLSMGWFTTEERRGVRHSVHRLRELPPVATERVTATDSRGAPRWADAGTVDRVTPVEVDRDRARPWVEVARDVPAGYDEVVHFFREMASRIPEVSVREIGRSRAGRAIHLVTLAGPGAATPTDAHGSGRPILFVGAQVHGDEPASQAGVLRFARDLAEGPLRPLLDDLVVLLVPLMNPDGAETGEWGIRNNLAGYNLNRDYLVLDNPESRAIIHEVLVPWRPHVVVDAHELVGPPRVYDFYTWHPTNPHGPRAPMELAGDRLIPALVEALEADGHSHIIYHTPGGLAQILDDPEIGISVPVFGRTLNDYAASQGLATILLESLRERDARVDLDARANRQHISLESIARTMAEDRAGTLAALRDGRSEMKIRGARMEPSDSIGILREPVASRRVDYEVAVPTVVDTPDGPRTTFTGETARVEVPVFDSARVVIGRERPVGYLIEPHRGDLVGALLEHGVVVERLLAPARWSVEHFRIREIEVAGSAYEGYIPQRFRTDLEAATVEIPAGAWFVPASQPGAALVFHLMEPEDENSFAITGAFMSEARVGGILPVHRVVERSPVARERVSPAPGR